MKNRIKLNTKELPKVKWVGVKESRYAGKINESLQVKAYIVLVDVGDGLGNRPAAEVAAEYGMVVKSNFTKRELANEFADEVAKFWGKEEKKAVKKTSVSMRLELETQKSKLLEESNKALEARIAEMEALVKSLTAKTA